VAMQAARANDDLEEWMQTHRDFHRLCSARANEPLMRVIHSYSQRTERYLRLYQLLDPNSYERAHKDHQAILEAVISGDRDEAGARMAHHLENTGLTVLRNVSADSPGRAIREALEMAISGSVSTQANLPEVNRKTTQTQ